MPTKSTPKLFETIDQAPGYFFLTDSSAQILYANQAIFSRTGYSPAEAIGRDPGTLWGGLMPESFYSALWEKIAEHQRPFTKTAKNKRKNGEHYEEQLCIIPLLTKDSSIEYFLGFQPVTKNTSDKKRFQNLFSGSVSLAQESPEQFFPLVQKWIAAKIEISLPLRTHELTDLVQEIFIKTTEQQYHQRFRDEKFIRLAQQNTDQFDILYTTYHDRILHYFSKRLNSTQGVAEDLTQETFLKAFSHLSQFSPSNASYQTYLLRIAHNLLVNYYRKNKPVLWDESLLQNIPAPNQMRRLSTKLSIESALQELSQTDREILLWFYEYGMSTREIATRLQKTENAVKLKISRARKKLLPYLQEKT